MSTRKRARGKGRPVTRTETSGHDSTAGYIVGRAAYFEPPPHPAMARRRANRLTYEAYMAIRGGADDAERLAREALEHLVDAFLLDRAGNADCFAQAHRLGREIEGRFGCKLSLDEGERHWSSQCGVHALHQRLGSSPGGPTFSECSICGAADFECDHIPGERYEGERCARIIIDWDLLEVSLVRFPKDPRCYRLFIAYSVEEVQRARGRPLLRGEAPLCTHCRDCTGHAGPTAEDVDQSLWPDPAINSSRGRNL